MANLTVQTAGESFNVDFGVYAGVAVGFKKKSFQKSRISFELINTDEFINVNVVGSPDFAVSFNGLAGTLQIDTVAGVAPISNEDLYNKLVALL